MVPPPYAMVNYLFSNLITLLNALPNLLFKCHVLWHDLLKYLFFAQESNTNHLKSDILCHVILHIIPANLYTVSPSPPPLFFFLPKKHSPTHLAITLKDPITLAPSCLQPRGNMQTDISFAGLSGNDCQDSLA